MGLGIDENELINVVNFPGSVEISQLSSIAISSVDRGMSISSIKQIGSAMNERIKNLFKKDRGSSDVANLR